MRKNEYPLPKTLPIRLTEAMFQSIRTEADRLQIRPHDVARTALGIGLKAILEAQQTAANELEVTEIDMLKVKMFWVNDDLPLAQAEINDWLFDNCHVEIKRILQSADGEGDSSALVSIWYEEPNE